jgi:hypothetical protein
MTSPVHFGINFVTAIPLAHFLGWDSQLTLIFILSGVLIDLDHVFYFLIRYRHHSIKEYPSIIKHKRKHMEPGLYIFHSPEFNLALLICSILNLYARVILLSNMIHIILDIFEHYQYHHHFRWIKQWSLTREIILLVNSRKT